MILFYYLSTLVFGAVMYSLGKDAGKSNKYHVKYVENCTAQKRKTFHRREDAAKWVANFKLKHQGTRIEPDCWIDMVFTGEVVFDEGDPK